MPTAILPSTVMLLPLLASNFKPVVLDGNEPPPPEPLPPEPLSVMSLMLSSVMVLESERRSRPIPPLVLINKSLKLRIEPSAAAST